MNFPTHVITLIAVFVFCGAANSQPALRTFSFAASEQKIIPGTSGQKKSSGWQCDGVIKEVDKIGNLALLAQFYQNGCYIDGRYNHADYKVEKGTIKSSDGGIVLEAYRVHGPARKATQFLGSNHFISFKVPKADNYSVYQFDGFSVTEVAKLTSDQVVAGQFNDFVTLSVSGLTAPTVYFIQTSGQPISSYHNIAPGVQGATIGKFPIGTVATYHYKMQATPYDTRSGFSNGPNSHANVYSQGRQFFPLNLGQQVGVVWQEAASKRVYLTRFNTDLKGQTTTQVTMKAGMRLASAATDQKSLYILLVQDGIVDQKSKTVTIQKADMNGKVLLEKNHDSGPSGMNITEFGEGNVASMTVSNGKVAVLIGRTMHKSPDGLNHQGGIGLVFSGANLNLIKNLGQTSGHSFENMLTTAASGEFLGIDLGDNYPRGVHLHLFSDAGIKSRVVYTFKTHHGESANSPSGKTYDRYNEASVGGKTFYKWSNDNNTYTELGAVVEVSDGFLVFFVGEPDANGKSINNGRAQGYLLDCRNVGFVKIKKSFSTGPFTNASVLPSDMVLSNGPAEESGFYDFGGGWSAQRNAGVSWLTAYKNPTEDNASRLRAVPLAANSILLLWELWTQQDYKTTYAMRVDATGKALSQPVELGKNVRINRRDDVLVRNGKAYLVTGNAEGKKLELVIIE